MKIIDLLNKIANGEEVPIEIKINMGNGRIAPYSLNDEEYIKELNRKLQEEVNEYLEEENIEEMVDILEVIRAILEHKGVTYDEIEEKRIKKANKRGGFKEKIFLEKVLQNGD